MQIKVKSHLQAWFDFTVQHTERQGDEMHH